MAAYDTTFQRYTYAEAKSYSSIRGTYSLKLYETVLNHHRDAEGKFDLVVDVGCGPGNATQDIAQFFDRAVGIDPGEGMIGMARSQNLETKSGKDVEFSVWPAEQVSKAEALELQSVDLVISATAAHWFDMDQFWAEASNILKPGGMVAIWAITSLFCHPSTPNATEVQGIIDQLWHNILEPYETPNSRIAREGYRDLRLPWDVTPSVDSFSRSSLWRHIYDENGQLDDGLDFFAKSAERELEDWTRTIQMSRGMKGWRDAHPNYQGPDPVAEAIMSIRQLIGSNTLRCGTSLALIMFHKETQESIERATHMS